LKQDLLVLLSKEDDSKASIRNRPEASTGNFYTKPDLVGDLVWQPSDHRLQIYLELYRGVRKFHATRNL